MSKIEIAISNALNRNPKLKTLVKRVYQLAMYTISPKIKVAGDIQRITPQDGYEYFFGYYDTSPWDATDRYMLCLRVKDTTKSVAPDEPAEIILLDTSNNNSFEVLAKTDAWNVQQGCMLKWLGPDCQNKIIYNDFRDGQYCSVILNINTGQESVMTMPLYAVSADGKFALTLDFSRLHRLRKGYGYSNLPDATKNEKCPDSPCIWHINLDTGVVNPLMTYTDFASFEPRSEMEEAEHKVNHIMIDHLGYRFMVLHRWLLGHRKYTRLLTANCDGTGLFNLSDDGMVSHCCWKNEKEILAYAYKKSGGYGFYLLFDKSNEYKKMWADKMISDGHPSYSPDERHITVDTYPDSRRLARIFCIDARTDQVKLLAKVFASFRYDNDVRCDLHPRWNRAGDKICFDSVFNGIRNLYVVNAVKDEICEIN